MQLISPEYCLLTILFCKLLSVEGHRAREYSLVLEVVSPKTEETKCHLESHVFIIILHIHKSGKYQL